MWGYDTLINHHGVGFKVEETAPKRPRPFKIIFPMREAFLVKTDGTNETLSSVKLSLALVTNTALRKGPEILWPTSFTWKKLRENRAYLGFPEKASVGTFPGWINAFLVWKMISSLGLWSLQPLNIFIWLITAGKPKLAITKWSIGQEKSCGFIIIAIRPKQGKIWVCHDSHHHVHNDKKHNNSVFKTVKMEQFVPPPLSCIFRNGVV